ncbi:hypothetical protein Tco_1389757 [Tanacetum coccineum]
MTIAEYELYIAKQGLRKNPLNDHSYRFTFNFCDQSSYTPNPQPDDKELSFEEVFGNLFRIGAKNIRGMKQDEAKVEDCDEGDLYDIWDITVEDVKRLRQLLIPAVHTLPKPDPVEQLYVPLIPFPNEVKVARQEEPDDDSDSIPTQAPDVNDDLIQPLIPQPIHTTPLDDAYVVTNTDLILDELLEEFRDEILKIIMVDEEANFNRTRDIKELERLIATDHESSFIEIKVLPCIVKTNVEHETFIRQMNPLYKLSQLVKSSTKTGKKWREMTSPLRYNFKISFPYPVANLHPHGLCGYYHPNLISSEGMNTPLLAKRDPTTNRWMFMIILASSYAENHSCRQQLWHSYYDYGVVPPLDYAVVGLVDARGVVLGWLLAARKPFKPD